jgi:hypothetical protein
LLARAGSGFLLILMIRRRRLGIHWLTHSVSTSANCRVAWQGCRMWGCAWTAGIG